MPARHRHPGEGRLVESGESQAIFDDPQHAYTRGLLAWVLPLEAAAAHA